MSIMFKDFESSSSYGGSGAVISASKSLNAWIENNKVDVINIESIYEIAGFIALSGSVGTEFKALRLWYTSKYKELESPAETETETFKKTHEKIRENLKEIISR